MGKMLTIHDGNWRDFVDPHVNGETKKCGTLPRDYGKYPHGCFAFAKKFDIPLLPESEWESRLKAQKDSGASLQEIRDKGMDGRPIPSRDQNGKGYCWMHSGCSASLLVRALNNQPYADLSAYAGACIIKNYRDEGGWGSEGVEFIAERGLPTSEFWPQKSMSRANDNPRTWENAKLHRATEWMDLDPDQMWAQMVTCFLLNIPMTLDFNWWSHSVGGMRLLNLRPKKILIWNSWGDEWSDNGAGEIEGEKAVADGAMAVRVLTASMI